MSSFLQILEFRIHLMKNELSNTRHEAIDNAISKLQNKDMYTS